MNRKGFAPIIILFLVVGVLIISGVWYYKNKSVEVPKTVNQTTQQSVVQMTPDTATTTATIQKIDTSNWEFYRSPGFNFSFKHPPGWRVEVRLEDPVTHRDILKGGKLYTSFTADVVPQDSINPSISILHIDASSTIRWALTCPDTGTKESCEGLISDGGVRYVIHKNHCDASCIEGPVYGLVADFTTGKDTMSFSVVYFKQDDSIVPIFYKILQSLKISEQDP